MRGVSRPGSPTVPSPEGRSSLFLWHGRALYVGAVPVYSFAPHRHHAAQAGISLGAPFRVRSGEHEPFEPCAGFVVAPDTPHQGDVTGAPGVFVWADSEHLADRISRKEDPPLRRLGQREIEPLLPKLRAASATPLDCAGADALFRLVVHALSREVSDERPEPPPDERIRDAIGHVHGGELLRAERPIARLAARAYLSEDRFRHLFRAWTGISVGRYLLWERLLTALDEAAKGASLSEAAHSAGFADQAHLSREFRATFGLTPSEVFKNSRLVQVVPCSAK